MNWRRAALPLALALAPGGCGRPAALPVDARPALFRVSDGDTTIWLLGSIHLLPPEIRWRTPAIEQAIGAADELMIESAPDDRAGFAEVARGQGLPPIASRVAVRDRAALDLAIARAGVARATLDPQKSWAAATMLATGDAIAGGATVADGVETVLWRAFAGRRRAGLYRAKDQLAMLDALPSDLQDQMLARALQPGERYVVVLRAWEKGDLTALDPRSDRGPLAGRLVGQPNRRWADWIAARMKRPGKVLVAIGAGHLAGPYALPAMLAGRDLRIERLQ
ncbi:TraB/GumN family protein [uncultured Sphingomonas sp.]|uniref:TraB/GumN family protein n=1 Tax=uncultured Sphingomonas sp. TaxID=158754 RepID=UPI0035CC4FDB